MTRARKSLTLTRAVYRRIFGNEQHSRASLPSRFLARNSQRTRRHRPRLHGRNRPDPPLRARPRILLLPRRIRPSRPRHSAPIPHTRAQHFDSVKNSTLRHAPPQHSAKRPPPTPCSAKKSATPNTASAPSSASKATKTTANSPSPSPAAAPKNSSNATPNSPKPSLATSCGSEPGESLDSPVVVREALGADRALPQSGERADVLLQRAADLLSEHSLFNAHLRFWDT